MKSLQRIFVTFIAFAALGAPLRAQDGSSETDKRISDLEKKIEQLLKEKEAPKLRLMNSSEQERTLDPVALSGFYDDGYLILSSSDGAYKYWVDGRVNLDGATYRGAANRLPSGFEVRRARLGVKGTLARNFLAEFDLDFADNGIEIKDMWAGYAGFKNSIIRAGNHKAPFGFDTLTSSKNTVFIERAYLDAWSPDRLLGLSYSRWGRNWQFSTGVFGQAGGAFDDKDTLTGGGAGTSQEPSFVGRLTFVPLQQQGRVLHIGIAADHMKPEVGKIATSGSDLPDRLDASRVVKLDSRAETHVSRAKFLSTGDMKYVSSLNQIGAELAGVFGPVTLQSEYQRTKVNRTATNVTPVADHTFVGYYAQVSWFVTGDSRPYSVSEGEFGRVIPKHKSGALELGLRYSTLDLNDRTAVNPITGGSAKNLTAGATWFFNTNHKVMLNITKVNNDQFAKPGKDWAPLPAGTSTTQTPVLGDDFTTIAIRYAIAF
jgi:phosphate-selective porin OprO and OprP